MIQFLVAIFLSFAAFAAEKSEPREPTPYEAAVIDGREAQRKGLTGKALEAYDRAIKLDPKQPAAQYFRGEVLSLQRKPEEAVEAFTKVIEMDSKASSAFKGRAKEEFKLGQIEKSVDDFNRYVELEPRREPYEWERGIALYYAGKFTEGRKQFEKHQSVNPHDVENGVWHFMCVARESSFEKARQSMLPISGDLRVPMREIYDLYGGSATPDDVLQAAKKGGPSEAELEARRFYAHLYLGLYFEAKGDKERSYEHMKRAATEFAADHYMGDVARVHFKRMVGATSAK